MGHYLVIFLYNKGMLINKAKQYVDRQIAKSTNMKNKLKDPHTGQAFKQRSTFLKLRKYYDDFSAGHRDTRWITILGLRGVGKTILTQQLFSHISCAKEHKLFVSVDKIHEAGLTLKLVLDAYEARLGVSYGQLKHPIYLFIDEIHYEPRWVLMMKVLHDRNYKIFIVTTGSSIYSLHKSLNADAARRIHIEQLHPMSFTEYMLFFKGLKPVTGLGKHLRHLMYEASNLQVAYQELQKLEPQIKSYYAQCKEVCQTTYSDCIKRYILQGNMPYCIHLTQRAVRLRTMSTIKNIIEKDLSVLSSMRDSTLEKIEDILHGISNSSTLSARNLCSLHELSKATMSNILYALREANIVKRIFPYSSHKSQISKPAKYVFISPIYRDTLLNNQNLPSPTGYEDTKGLLLEDVIQLYLAVLLDKQRPNFEGKMYCDPSQGGADFIFGYQNSLVALEVGWQKRSAAQIHATFKRHAKCNRGIIISDADRSLKLYSDNVIGIPLSAFLLSAWTNLGQSCYRLPSMTEIIWEN